MCGIVGLVAKSATRNFVHKEKSMFANMLYIDALRGTDSTGVYMVNKYGNVRWAKSTDMPHDFLKNYQAKDILDDMYMKGVAMVGHNRKATAGSIKDENAHPFIEDNIILVHNGTLKNHKTLNTDVEVDSHAIAHAIKDHGVEAAIGKIDGAFAVAAYDTDERKLHLFRNKERPLYLAEYEDFWAFASEPWMIFGTGWREELKPKSLMQIDEAKIYTFDLSENKTKLLDAKEVELYKEPTKSFFPIVIKPKTEKAANETGTQSETCIGKKPTVTEFINYFRKTNYVCFKPQSVRTSEGYKSIVGEHCFFDGVEVVGWMKPDITRESLNLHMSQNELVGEITSIRHDSTTSRFFVYCKEVEFSAPRVSKNGIIINEELLYNLMTLQCSTCKGEIQEEELEDAYVQVRKNGKVIEVCPFCYEEKLKKNPKWGTTV